MKNIGLNIEKALGAVSKEQVYAQEAKVMECIATLHNGNGAGNDFLGWLHLPSSITDEELTDIENTAKSLREKCEVIVAIGIGGSYLGTKAVVEALNNSFDWLQTERKNPILLAFRLLKKQLEEAVGVEEAKKRIVAITDAKKGALRTLADQEGYKTFVIPDNVGGRFSVLTPVGLLPIAVAGINIRDLVAGAVSMEKATDQSVPFAENISAIYAATRNELYKSGKKIEILCNFHPKLHYIAEWWKQLYGESEGKDGKGIFPASVDLTTDLHSMGQWIQDGERSIYESVISVEKPDHEVVIPSDEANLDGLNFLAGKRVDEVNKMAELGTQLAHVDGGVPNIKITMPEVSAYYIGQLFYFFEKACGISGYILGVNPFNQPGVEAYKKNMFALLNKPGYEKESAAIQARL